MYLQILKNPNLVRHEILAARGNNAANEAVVGELHGDLPLSARVLIDGGIDDIALYGASDGGDDVEGDDSNICTAALNECLTDTVCAARCGDEEGIHGGVVVNHPERFLISMDVVVRVLHDGCDSAVLFDGKAAAESLDTLIMPEHTLTAVADARTDGAGTDLALQCCRRTSTRRVVAAHIDVGLF